MGLMRVPLAESQARRRFADDDRAMCDKDALATRPGSAYYRGMHNRFSIIALAVALASACDKSEEPAPQTTAPATAAELQEAPKAAAEPAPLEEVPADEDATGELPGHPRPSLTGEVMRGHFEQADEAFEALIRADMDTAKKAMAWLGGHELGAVLPEELKPLQVNMQSAAKTFGDAKNLREGGVALANTLTRCGHCHQTAKKGPEIATDPLPDGKDLAAHMKRHHWAVRQLWAGLVTGSDETFATGVDVLQDPPLSAEALTTVEKDAAQAKVLDAHVHELAARLKNAKNEAERADAYGHMLATCAVCHRMTGKGPQPIGPVE